MRPTPLLALAALLLSSLAAAQQAHPGSQNATAALHEDLARSTAASRALLPLVASSMTGQTATRGFSFGDLDVKVNAEHTSSNTCIGTIYSWWAMTVIQYYTFGQSGIWSNVTQNLFQQLLTAALQRLIVGVAAFTLEKMAEALVEELEPYRNTAQFSKLDAYLFTLQVLGQVTNTLPTTRLSTSATFKTQVALTPSFQPTTVKNRFDVVSSITTHTSVRTAGIVECYTWYLANFYSLLGAGIPLPEEWFYRSTSLDRTFAPRGQAALSATVTVDNAPQVTGGELSLKRTSHTVTGAPRDDYQTSAFPSEVPPTLRYGGSDLEFKLQIQRHLLSVLEKLLDASYDARVVNELLLLDDRLDADTFFQKSDVTSTARFNLAPAAGAQAELWAGPNVQLQFATGGANLGSLRSIPGVFMSPLNVGAINASPFAPPLAPYAAALVTPEASLVAPAEKGLYVLRGLEDHLFTNPQSSADLDLETKVVARLDTQAPIFDLVLRGKVLGTVAPPRLYESGGKRYVEVHVQLRLDASSVQQSISGTRFGDATFVTEVDTEYFKVFDEQRRDRTTARYELRLVPGQTRVSTTIDPMPLFTRPELEQLLADLLHPRLSRAIQAMTGNRTGNLHDLGAWGGLQSMVQHQLQQPWNVGTNGPNELRGLRLKDASIDLQLDFGVRAPRPYPTTVPLNPQGDVVTTTQTEHVPSTLDQLPQADYAVRHDPQGNEKPFVVVCRYSFMAPNGTQPPVRVYTSYAYATTRVLRGEKRQVLTDEQFFNPDNGPQSNVGTGKLGATNSNIARRIFDESNPAIPDICKIRRDDHVYYVSNFAPHVDPTFTLAVYAEYDHGLEKSDVCNPLVSFDRVPYLPLLPQAMPIDPKYTAAFDLTGAAAARKHVVGQQSCKPVEVLLVDAGGGGEPNDPPSAVDATEPFGRGNPAVGTPQ